MKQYDGTAGEFLYRSVGTGIEPVIKPLGFDWKLGIGLLSGVGAKELVVSTLGVLYADDPEADAASLAERIPITPLVAFCYMLFVLIYFPCIAALAAIKQESGSWKWALFAAAIPQGWPGWCHFQFIRLEECLYE